MASYMTVGDFASCEIEVKKSKFICSVKPVSSNEEAMDFLNKIKAENREARHNVYAYVLRDKNYCRFSDDGEPSGTAGKPVLEVIKGFDLTDLCVVVTRYFGGVLLGTGGLARAYSDSARLCLEKANKIEIAQMAEFICRFDYTYFSRISSLIFELNGTVTNTVYDDCVNLSFYIPLENSDKLSSALSELTLGKIHAKHEGISYKQKKF